MFSTSEKYYDEIYAALGKDYVAEANLAHAFIQKHKRTRGNNLLDVACGTGTHAGLLSEYYHVHGLDLDWDMLKVGRKKHPQIRFHQGDMTGFKLDVQFDVITCLFSSIGYVKSRTNLHKAIKTMSRHLLPGGILLVEPWFNEAQWVVPRSFVLRVEKPDLKIIRMSYGAKRGKISVLDFHYLVSTPKGVRYSVERHEMGLFTHDEYLAAFRLAGLKVTHDKKGLDGRGLYIGRRPRKP